MKSMTAQQILELAAKANSSRDLLSRLCEDLNFSNGQAVFIVHGMGQASVRGTYQGQAGQSGMAKVKRDGDGTVFTVMSHLVFPQP